MIEASVVARFPGEMSFGKVPGDMSPAVALIVSLKLGYRKLQPNGGLSQLMVGGILLGHHKAVQNPCYCIRRHCDKWFVLHR